MGDGVHTHLSLPHKEPFFSRILGTMNKVFATSRLINLRINVLRPRVDLQAKLGNWGEACLGPFLSSSLRSAANTHTLYPWVSAIKASVAATNELRRCRRRRRGVDGSFHSPERAFPLRRDPSARKSRIMRCNSTHCGGTLIRTYVSIHVST